MDEDEARRQLQLALTADPGHQQTLAALGMAPPPPATAPAEVIDLLQPATSALQPAVNVPAANTSAHGVPAAMPSAVPTPLQIVRELAAKA